MSDPTPISLLEKMVAIRTVNPPGEGYRAFQRFIRGKLREFKIRSRTFEFVEGKPNLLACIGKGRPHLLLSSHIDVVTPGGGWKTDPFVLSKNRGTLTGRGVVDAKGSLAAMLTATLAYANRAKEMSGTLMFAPTTDEETGGFTGLGALAKHGLTPDCAVIGEPTDLGIAICQKGVCWYEVIIEGKAAHAATPQFGINAIEQACNLVTRLQSFKPRLNHRLLGRPTRNVGLINGGTATNTVPDRCTISIDRRLLPRETPQGAEEEVEKELRQLKNTLPQLQYHVREILTAVPFELSPNLRFINQVSSAIKLITRRSPPLKGIYGFTDARHLRPSSKRPAVILGPGSISQAHVPNEHMHENQLTQAARIYEKIIDEVLIKGKH
jgi:acetylornithine deacetylase/succinyl-diaminopimelate desuccinylase family protein